MAGNQVFDLFMQSAHTASISCKRLEARASKTAFPSWGLGVSVTFLQSSSLEKTVVPAGVAGIQMSHFLVDWIPAVHAGMTVSLHLLVIQKLLSVSCFMW